MEVEVLVPEGALPFDLPLSQGIKYNGFIFVSGQVAFNPQGNLVGRGDIKKADGAGASQPGGGLEGRGRHP